MSLVNPSLPIKRFHPSLISKMRQYKYEVNCYATIKDYVREFNLNENVFLSFLSKRLRLKKELTKKPKTFNCYICGTSFIIISNTYRPRKYCNNPNCIEEYYKNYNKRYIRKKAKTHNVKLSMLNYL